MKTTKVIFLLILIISSTNVQAGNIYRPYYRDRNVERFQETGRIEDFAAIDDEFRSFALSNLLANPDGDPSDRDAVIIHDRAAIYKKFLDTATTNEQLQIFIDGFDLAARSPYSSQAKDIFNRAMAKKPSIAGKMICNTIIATQFPDEAQDDDEEPFTFDDSKLPENATMINGLLPFIAQSGSSSTFCNFGTDKNPRLMTLAEIVSRTSDDLYAKLYNLNREVQAANLRVQGEYLNCSVAQVRTSLFSGLTILKDLKVGTSQYIITDDKGCVINGLLKKVNSGYEFYPSNGVAGYQKRSLNFKTLEEIVQLMKATPVAPTLKAPAVMRVAVVAPNVQTKERTAEQNSFAEKLKMSQFGDLIKFFKK